MQPLNDDMDELMRKAAAEYPVIPQGADWQKVAQQLEAPEPVATPVERHGGLKKLLLLLPLLLASFVCDRFLQYEYGFFKKTEAPGSNISTGVAAIPAGKNNIETSDQEPVKTGFKKGGGTLQPVQEVVFRTKNRVVARQVLPGTRDILKSNVTAPKDGEETAVLPARRTPFLPDVQHRLTTPDARNIQPGNVAVRPQVQANTPKKAGQEKTETFYASVLMGPDVSRVKDQKTEKSGYSVGLLAGYNFGRHWAVETGLFWDKKNYFSKGEYFKTDKINLPQHSEVIQVDGYCTMFEIPLNIRYNALRNRRNVWYASAGVSSYLMLKEDYDYIYRRYNEDYEGNKVYTNASKDWFAVANAAIGYEHRLGGKTKIRIEPYIRVPLKGVGIGSMPLSSAGILVGITYPIQ